MNLPRYHAAIEAARRVALALTVAQQRALLAILEDYARDIEARVTGGLRGGTNARLLQEVRAVIAEMTRDMAGSVGSGIRQTARRLAEIQSTATLELVASSATRIAVAEAFAATGARAAAAVIARPELAEAFVTIRREASSAANRILTRGMVRGAPAQAVARELRQFVSLPGSRLQGKGSVLDDRRRIGFRQVQALGYDPTPENLALVRRDASRIAYRASTIARTEIMQAEAEVLRQGAEDSPVVALVEIRLSYRHSEPCACEPIAQLDLYGHGPGRYDPRNVPPRPHPRCWCPRKHILRPESDWGAERGPTPVAIMDLESVAEESGLSPSAQKALLRAIQVGAGRESLQLVEA